MDPPPPPPPPVAVDPHVWCDGRLRRMACGEAPSGRACRGPLVDGRRRCHQFACGRWRLPIARSRWQSDGSASSHGGVAAAVSRRQLVDLYGEARHLHSQRTAVSTAIAMAMTAVKHWLTNQSSDADIADGTNRNRLPTTTAVAAMADVAAVQMAKIVQDFQAEMRPGRHSPTFGRRRLTHDRRLQERIRAQHAGAHHRGGSGDLTAVGYLTAAVSP